MFGIAFDNKDNIGIVTENGEERYDEINLIKKGGNYGFPTFNFRIFRQNYQIQLWILNP